MRLPQRLGLLFGCLLLWSAGLVALGPLLEVRMAAGASRDSGSKADHLSLAADVDEQDFDGTGSGAAPLPAVSASAGTEIASPGRGIAAVAASAQFVPDRRTLTLVGVVLLQV